MQSPAAAARRHARSAVPMRLRTDEQLVRLFRAGSEDAFRAIHDRYRARLFAYARQMLSGDRQDAEDALQDVFIRAHAGLRNGDGDVSLRAWLYRIMHNRCIDQIRRPLPPPPETFELLRPPTNDPIAIVEQRESLRRLVADVRRLPEQQRSALLMREIGGMSYDEVGVALDVTLPAVKSTLARARAALMTATEARDTTCIEIREQLTTAHDRSVRFNGLVRRHLHDCDACTAYSHELRATRKRFAALTPAFGPGALIAKLLGGTALLGGGAGGATALGGGSAAVGGGLFALTTGQVAAVVAAGALGVGGISALQHDAPTHAHQHATHTATVAQTRPLRLRPIAATDVHEHVAAHARHGLVRRQLPPGSPHPLERSFTPLVAKLGTFHLVRSNGLFAPADMASAPRGSAARSVWVVTSTTLWLNNTVEGRRMLASMQQLPAGVELDFQPEYGNDVFMHGETFQARITTPGVTADQAAATQEVISMWIAATPQGKRDFLRRRALATRHAAAKHTTPPASSPDATPHVEHTTTTMPATTTPAPTTTVPPAPTTTVPIDPTTSTTPAPTP